MIKLERVYSEQNKGGAKPFNYSYGGLMLKVYDCCYSIYGPHPEKIGKWKEIRRCGTYGKSTGNDHEGKLYKAYESDQTALSKAIDWINNFYFKNKRP